jgi:L,D-transpeptidase ErfK/SrfK
MKLPSMWRHALSITTALVIASMPLKTLAANYALPDASNALIGGLQYTSASYGETTGTVAQRYNLGLNAVVAANPGVEDNTPFINAHLRIPTQFLLPPLARKGIVINLPEMRLYFYPGNGEVMTFPVGIGKIGKTIPITNTAITRKVVNPTWTPTPSIREFNRDQGIELPRSMGPGPDNPLGPYAIYLRVPTYLIHSTIFPESIGRRASFGCIRMNEGDIRQFFPLVEPGMPVAIIDMPTKIAWEGDKLYIESHPPLEERGSSGLSGIVDEIQQSIPNGQVVLVDWQAISYLSNQPDGVPHEIGFRVK